MTNLSHLTHTSISLLNIPSLEIIVNVKTPKYDTGWYPPMLLTVLWLTLGVALYASIGLYLWRCFFFFFFFFLEDRINVCGRSWGLKCRILEATSLFPTVVKSVEVVDATPVSSESSLLESEAGDKSHRTYQIIPKQSCYYGRDVSPFLHAFCDAFGFERRFFEDRGCLLAWGLKLLGEKRASFRRRRLIEVTLKTLRAQAFSVGLEQSSRLSLPLRLLSPLKSSEICLLRPSLKKYIKNASVEWYVWIPAHWNERNDIETYYPLPLIENKLLWLKPANP